MCQRCNDNSCNDPDSKWCSDIILMRYGNAIREAINELGVPQPEYPAPVANAYEILNKAIS
jgi:hypothetical protein